MSRALLTILAVTLVPLTPPSTHLVSITLALILLVDRLLTLLRHRGELLELTGLRLEWDDTRWKVMQLCRAQSRGIIRAIEEKSNWKPGQLVLQNFNDDQGGSDGQPASRTVSSPKKGSGSSPQLDAPKTPRAEPSRLAEHAGGATPISALPSSSFTSPGTLVSQTPTPTPANVVNNQWPTLHSQLLTLRHEQRNLTGSLLPRTATLLDRMIDLAGPLKDLGDTSGPGPVPLEGSDQARGAVPEHLLDLQDRLEGEVAEVDGKVQWAKSLESTLRSAHDRYTLFQAAQATAEDILSRLMNGATSTPPTASQLQAMKANLADVARDLGDDDDATWQVPVSHPDYPQDRVHNLTVRSTLVEARSAGIQRLKRSQEALEWVECVQRSKLEIERCRTSIRGVIEEIDELYNRDLPLRSMVFSGLADLLQSPVDERSIEDAGDWSEEARACSSRGSDLMKEAGVVATRYKALVNGPPRPLREHMPADRKICDSSLQEDMNEINDKLQRLQRDSLQLDLRRQAVPLLRGIMVDLPNLEHEVAQLRQSIDTDIVGSAWTSDQSSTPISAPHNAQIGILENKVTDLISSRLDKARRLVTSSSDKSLQWLDSKLDHRSDDLRRSITYSKDAWSLLLRVQRQSEVVHEVQREAQSLEERLSMFAAKPSLAHLGPEGGDLDPEGLSQRRSVNLKEIGEEHLKWENGLAQRIPFLGSRSTPRSTSYTGNSIKRFHPMSPTASSSEPPMTPPSSPPRSAITIPSDPDSILPSGPVGLSHGFDLTALDGRVRKEINAISSRVGATLSRARIALEAAKSPAVVQRTTEPNGSPNPDVINAAAFPDPPSGTASMAALLGPPRAVLTSQAPPSPSPAPTTHRHRVVSDFVTPSRSRRVSGIPAPTSKRLSTPSTSTLFASTGSIGSGSSSQMATMPSLSRVRHSTPASAVFPQSSSNGVSSPALGIRNDNLKAQKGKGKVPRKTYVPDPNNQLDIAVGKIINTLKINVPVVPVGPGNAGLSTGRISSSASVSSRSRGVVVLEDDWQDLSGKYWIGADGRAKVYFCRILRSKMVMVRVGGGWVELSSFLMDHFADTIASLKPLNDPGAPSSTSNPRLVTSRSVSAGLSRVYQEANLAESGIHIGQNDLVTVTPARARHAVPFPQLALAPASSTKTLHVDDALPASSVAATPRYALSPRSSSTSTSTNTSTLVPLQFMRKASESPPMLQKEKARLSVGRRSILGKGDIGSPKG